MNKRQKKQLADKFAVLYQVHSMLSANGIIMEQLENCQEFAIEIGTQIDRLAGEGTKAVSLLEAYCEKVYQAGMAEEKHERAMNIKAMEKLAKAAEKSLWYDIPCGKKEIVFFPYKASMWDSLESIYLAAKEDQQCECYVVPIPYFDKNSDGTIGQMHYEGGDLPKDIPVVDWKEYDVTIRKPDVAYIHNPYDGQNYVTTVHPYYYSKELKKHVGKLIYCPYFVSEEVVDRKYCSLPGVLWADKVMVQSEHIRKQYIQHYDEVITDEKVREVLGSGEEKFVALGSPKVDKVRFTNKDDVELPEEWKMLCRDKKIFFYNNHLSEALTLGEVFLEKLKGVLAFFEGNMELVLWWRPHPLSQETMTALKPEILKEYNEIVEKYREKAYGIYDDTPFWHRAVIWADFYYGSKSSLLPLFGITGKPVILQKTDSMYDKYAKEKKFVSYEVFVPDGERIYFLSSQLGALVSLHLETEEWRLEAILPMELQGEISVFSRMYVWKDKIYIFVVNANAHFVYDKKEKRFEKVEWGINNVLPMYSKQIKFADVLNYNQYYIMMPHRFDAILVYDRESNEVVVHTEWIEELRKQIPNFQKKECFFRIRSVCLVENWTFAVLRQEGISRICQFSMPNMKLVKIHEIPLEGEVQGLEFDGEKLWFVHDYDWKLVKWDWRNNIVCLYDNFLIDKTVKDVRYRLVVINKSVYMPHINKNETCFCIEGDELVAMKNSYGGHKDHFKSANNEMCVMSSEEPEIFFVDQNWNIKAVYRIKVPLICENKSFVDELIKIKTKALFNDSDVKCLLENEWVQFYDWFRGCTQVMVCGYNRERIEQKYSELFEISERSAGSLIHEYVLKELEN